MPQETLDHPFDVTLVVEDGKKFKAHRRVLSKASPFFEKLLKSDMKESNQGVIRLEMLTELCLRDILEFIYTGSVKISTEDNAQELIAMADYLVLPDLKTMAEKLLVDNEITVSNAISTHYFAERYRCEELVSVYKNFILANFTTVAKTEEFFNLPSREVKMWISSDEIDVSAEEDVFQIITLWIDHEKSERKKYFAELFREVRLVYVSRDFLHSDVVTNDLVNDNEGCMDLVRHAMELIDSENYHHHTVRPRKSLEIPVILIFCARTVSGHQILCYYPREDKWSRFPGTVPPPTNDGDVYFHRKLHFLSCHGQLYFISQQDKRIWRYDSFSDCWTSLPLEEQRILWKVFVRNEDEIYALVSEDFKRSCPGCASLYSRSKYRRCEKIHLFVITKYKPESNSWEDISSFDLGTREKICVVAKDNFIYFLGSHAPDRYESLKDADMFDLKTNTWHKIADLKEPRVDAYGVSAYGKVFIVGGCRCNSIPIKTGEAYHETTNEWQRIAKLSNWVARLNDTYNCLTGVCADGRLYLISIWIERDVRKDRVIECYDSDKNEWNVKTQIPRRLLLFNFFGVFCCSMTVLKGCKFLQQASMLVEKL